MNETSPKFLSVGEVVLIHEQMIDRYGGSKGVLDQGRLDSAIAVPKQQFGGELLHQDLASQAGANLFHLAKGHAFVDGNKRVAAACADVFVTTNGARLSCTEDEYYRLTLGVADGSISKEQAIEFFQTHVSAISGDANQLVDSREAEQD